MRLYYTYLALSLIFLLLGLYAFYGVIASTTSDGFLLVGLIQIPLGLFQLSVALYLKNKIGQYPEWAKLGFANYWIAVAVYFIILFVLLELYDGPYELLALWLFIIPWGIAWYQFSLVYRLSHLRKKLVAEQNINHSL